MRRVPILSAIIFLVVQSPPTQKVDLPPVLWFCPMHPDILEAQKRTCNICKMDLVPTRLDTIWSCPVHSVVEETRPGKCPICGRDLVQVTVALSWTCPEHPEIDQPNPGQCPDGTAMVARHTRRPHGNHSPQHGGVFFMAPDNWHHLEGTYPEEGLFRLHLYDDYTKPLPSDQVNQASGRIVTKEARDRATGTMREITAYPLNPAADGPYLEAQIDRLLPPAEMIAKVQFKRDGPEYRFDFVFEGLSQDPTTPIVPSGVPSRLLIEIPDNPTEVLALLNARALQIRELIQKGAFGEIYVPAFQAKDLALALDLHAKELPPRQRAGVAAATERLVRSAWQLDAYGDAGNRDHIEEAYTTFARALDEVESAFSARRR